MFASLVVDRLACLRSDFRLGGVFIEPPDILVVEAIRVVPKSPYALRTGDVISIDVPNAIPGAPINGPYTNMPGGAVNLGREYGAIQIGGLKIQQAQIEITNYLIARAGFKL